MVASALPGKQSPAVVYPARDARFITINVAPTPAAPKTARDGWNQTRCANVEMYPNPERKSVHAFRFTATSSGKIANALSGRIQKQSAMANRRPRFSITVPTTISASDSRWVASRVADQTCH